MESAVIHSTPLIIQRDHYGPPCFDWECVLEWLPVPDGLASPSLERKHHHEWKKMRPRSDRFLPAVLFLLFSPSSLHPNGKFTPSSIIPFPPFPSSSFPICLPLFPFLLRAFHCAICTSARSFWVTAVHSPVPYCGAVHHLHAFSILQQNEFLIGPERGGRSGNRRWLF